VKSRLLIHLLKDPPKKIVYIPCALVAEESAENVLGIEILSVEAGPLSTLGPPEFLFRAEPIIVCSLLGIAQTSIGLTKPLKSLCGRWSPVSIRMQL
jgi:hypothetical protein